MSFGVETLIIVMYQLYFTYFTLFYSTLLYSVLYSPVPPDTLRCGKETGGDRRRHTVPAASGPQERQLSGGVTDSQTVPDG